MPWPAHPPLRDFAHVHEDVRLDAEAEAPSAARQLWTYEDRYAVASAVLGRRRMLRQTQKRIARASGLPQSEISRIEAGLANPTLATLGVLARALEIELRTGRRDAGEGGRLD